MYRPTHIREIKTYYSSIKFIFQRISQVTNFDDSATGACPNAQNGVRCAPMKRILLTCSLLLATYLPCSFAAELPKDAAAAPPANKGFSGKVVETMNAASYTYVLIDTGSEKRWVAAPQFPVKIGDTVAVPAGMEMKDYHSKTLNRDFASVYFTGGVRVNGKATDEDPTLSAGLRELPQGHPPIAGSAPQPKMPDGHPQIGAKTTAAAPDFSKIKKAQGGKTVAEIYSGKAKLNGQQTSVRGKVVKYNEQIMGKNWIHIQDGTGAIGSNDLLVTSATAVKVGDTVLVTGKVVTDKDFGSNYKYAIMIEDAKVVAE